MRSTSFFYCSSGTLFANSPRIAIPHSLRHTRKHLNRGAFLFLFCGANEDLNASSCLWQELGSHTATEDRRARSPGAGGGYLRICEYPILAPQKASSHKVVSKSYCRTGVLDCPLEKKLIRRKQIIIPDRFSKSLPGLSYI